METTIDAVPDLSHVPKRLLTLLEESIVPSPHSIDLAHSPESDFLYRQVRPKPHVAELYHENSKLHPYTTLQPVADPRVHEQIRQWFFDTAYAVKAEYLLHEDPALRLSLDDLPPPLADLLQPFSEPGTYANLLYSIDLLVLYGGLLTRLFPEAPYLWTEREINDQERQFLGMKLGVEPETWAEHTVAVLFAVACPWRYMLLHGPRGYRHTLLDVGRLLAYVEQEAPMHTFDVAVQQNYHDSAIDRMILADGLERSAYAIVHLRSPQTA